MRSSFDPAVLDRVYHQLRTEDQTRTCQAVLHMAIALMADDPASALTDVQRDWLTTRCQAPAARSEPLSPHECRRLVPVLLAWSAGKTWQAAMIDGLRGVVPEELLPEVSIPMAKARGFPEVLMKKD